MSISKEQVQKVAMLGRLKLSEEEAEQYTTQLNDILQFVEKLNELDTENVEPTSHVQPQISSWNTISHVQRPADWSCQLHLSVTI